MNLSANLGAPGAKAAVSTKISMRMSVENRCPTQDSLNSLGGNWEAISNCQSNSASDEANDQQVINVRKKRRMLSNRESARRSRLQQQVSAQEKTLERVQGSSGSTGSKNWQILTNFNIFFTSSCSDYRRELPFEQRGIGAVTSSRDSQTTPHNNKCLISWCLGNYEY